MKFTNKMILVPASRTDPTYNKMSELDKSMSEILKNQTLSSFQKMQLYHDALVKNLTVEANVDSSNISDRIHKFDDLLDSVKSIIDTTEGKSLNNKSVTNEKSLLDMDVSELNDTVTKRLYTPTTTNIKKEASVLQPLRKAIIIKNEEDDKQIASTPVIFKADDISMIEDEDKPSFLKTLKDSVSNYVTTPKWSFYSPIRGRERQVKKDINYKTNRLRSPQSENV